MSFIVVAAIAGGTALIAGGVSYGTNRKREKDAIDEKARIQGEIDDFKANRQDVIDNSDDIRALAAEVSNPFANLGVATQAAEFQAEEADIALAQTLDTLAASGASAGGATALARAALQSKRGISASIEQQEAQNQKMAAQGEAQAQQQRLNLKLAAEQEEAAAFARQEARDNIDLGMMRQDEVFQRDVQYSANLAKNQAAVDTVTNVGNAVGGAYTDYAYSGLGG